ncbi:MAG: hypothetical protein ACR2N1_18340 [Rubripirellula sp.]
MSTHYREQTGALVEIDKAAEMGKRCRYEPITPVQSSNAATQMLHTDRRCTLIDAEY